MLNAIHASVHVSPHPTVGSPPSPSSRVQSVRANLTHLTREPLLSHERNPNTHSDRRRRRLAGKSHSLAPPPLISPRSSPEVFDVRSEQFGASNWGIRRNSKHLASNLDEIALRSIQFSLRRVPIGNLKLNSSDSGLGFGDRLIANVAGDGEAAGGHE